MNPVSDPSDPPPRIDDDDLSPGMVASSPCLLESLDPAWYGGLSRQELGALLGHLLTGERARLARDGADPTADGYCSMLRRHWHRLDGSDLAASASPGSPAAAPETEPPETEPSEGVLQSLVRELRAALPRVFDDALHADLAAMLAAIEQQPADADPGETARGPYG